MSRVVYASSAENACRSIELAMHVERLAFSAENACRSIERYAKSAETACHDTRNQL